MFYKRKYFLPIKGIRKVLIGHQISKLEEFQPIVLYWIHQKKISFDEIQSSPLNGLSHNNWFHLISTTEIHWLIRTNWKGTATKQEYLVWRRNAISCIRKKRKASFTGSQVHGVRCKNIGKVVSTGWNLPLTYRWPEMNRAG